MPLKNVPPELGCRALGPEGWVVVFHAYKNGDYDLPLQYWFTVDPDELQDPFDIRMWDQYARDDDPLVNVVNAIIQGDITPQGATWES